MSNLKSGHFYTLLLLLLFSTEACKKKCYDKTNPDCENYDPCYGRSETKAQFIIEQYLGKWEGEDVWIEADTVYATGSSNPIRFSATCDADSFIWEIGANKYYKKSFTLTYFPFDKNIPITLIVIKNNPNQSCFPHDDGRDTLVRNMYTWKEEKYWDGAKYIYNAPHPVKGTYEGYFKSKPNTKTIIRFLDTSGYCENSAPKSIVKSMVYNIPYGYYSIDSCGYVNRHLGGLPFACLMFNDVTIGLNNKDVNQIYRFSGKAELLADRKRVKIAIKAYNVGDPTKVINDEFNGVKIK